MNGSAVIVKESFQSIEPRLAACKKLSGTLALVGMSIGTMGLAGWIFNIEVLKRVHPSLVTMKANTAICLILTGLALFLLQKEPVGLLKRRIANTFALLITIVGLLTFYEHLFHKDLGIDQIFFYETKIEAGQSFPGRMGVAASLNFTLLGLALLTLDLKSFRDKFWVTQFFTFTAILVTFLVFLYYFYGVEKFEPIAYYATIALHTVVALLSLCIGVLLVRPERGTLVDFLSHRTGSIVARRMIPAALLIPILLGWLSVLGQKQGFYGMGFGTAVFAGILVLIFTQLIWWTAKSVNEQEAQRREAENALRQSEALLRTVTNESRVGLVMIDQERRYLFANATYAKILGLPNANLVGRRVADVLPGVYDQIGPRLDQAFRGERVHYELTLPQSSPEHDRIYEVIYEPRIDPPNPFVVVVIIDITARKRAEQTLEKAHQELEEKVKQRTQELLKTNEELLRSNKELEAFAYVCSHDLQEPLRMVTSYVQLLNHSYKAGNLQEAPEYIECVVDGVQRMRMLINDLLNYSRVRSKPLDHQPKSLEELVQKAVFNLETSVRENHAQITNDPLPTLLVDETQMIQLFQNLISNAIKFTGDRVPKIHISARKEQKMWVICVQDNGIGIERQFQEKIFELFQRLHSRKQYSGTGIGLAICKLVVERHGGKIWVDSAPGRGSRFHFTIPFS